MQFLIFLVCLSSLMSDGCFPVVPTCLSLKADQQQQDEPFCSDACRRKLYANIEFSYGSNSWLSFLSAVYLFDGTGKDTYFGLIPLGKEMNMGVSSSVQQDSILFIAPLTGEDAPKWICFAGLTSPMRTLVFTVDDFLEVEPVHLSIAAGHGLASLDGIGSIYGVARKTDGFILYERAPQGAEIGDPNIKGRLFALNFDSLSMLIPVSSCQVNGEREN